MGKVHEFLGLKVGVVLNEMNNDERREAYNCDITYVTNNELGFDYLRDNMVIYKEQLESLQLCMKPVMFLQNSWNAVRQAVSFPR